jgi:GxxExxY protein
VHHEGTKIKKEDTKNKRGIETMTELRTVSHLPPEIERLAREVIDCCLNVHRILGPGMSETVYSRALRVELETRNISFEAERTLPVRYRGRFLCHQRVDLIVGDRVVLEVKSVEQIHPVHIAQVVGYLRLTGARIGFVVNFNVALLKHGIRRVVL